MSRRQDLVDQIKRDKAVLSGDPAYYAQKGDKEFYERRIEACRADAERLPINVDGTE